MGTRPTAIAAALALAALFACLGAESAGATFPGVNGRIVFARVLPAAQGAERVDLFSVNPDGSDVQRLTATGMALKPAVSPDGRTVAFESLVGSPHIALTGIAGGAETKLADGSGPPAWSPDGRRIAFEGTRDGNHEVFVMNADGSGQANLTNDPSLDYGPAWSPDGAHIAFGRIRSTDFHAVVSVMDAATGANQLDLTNTPATDLMPGSWSPDGSKLAFSVYQDGIYVINADGSGRRRLTSSAMFNSVGDAEPSWSPDGTKIVFTRVIGGNCTGPPVPWVGSQCKQLWVMNADGGGQTQLTDNPGGGDASPSWSTAPTAPAPAEDVIAHERGPTPMGAYHGRLVWSSFDPSTRLYSLVTWKSGMATAQRLPVRPRSVPFDVDLGPNRLGHVEAVYSRCTKEPVDRFSVNLVAAYNTGRGCDLYVFDFATSHESRVRSTSVPGGSEFLPTIWRSRIAFARVWEQRRGKAGVLSYVYTRRTDRHERSQRLAGGPEGQWRWARVSAGPGKPRVRQLIGGPGPTALDLRQGRLAVTWGYRQPGGASGSLVQLDDLSGGRKVVSQAATASRPGVTLLFGSLASAGLFWVQNGDDDTASPLLFNTFRRYDPGSGATTIAPAPDFLTSAVRDGATLYYTRALEPGGAVANRVRPCGRGADALSYPADCLVGRATPVYKSAAARRRRVQP